MNDLTHTDEVISKTSSVRRKKPPTSSLFSYRLMIAYRFLLALVGGYILAVLSSLVIAQTFASHKGSAAMTATLLAFVIWAGAFIWVFMVNKTLKASLGIFVPMLGLYLLYQGLGH